MAGHSQSDGKVDEVTFDSVHCCELGVHLSRHRRDSHKGVGGGGGGLKWHHVVHLHQSNVLKTRMRHWQGDVVVDEGWWEEGVCGGGGGGGGEGGITV